MFSLFCFFPSKGKTRKQKGKKRENSKNTHSYTQSHKHSHMELDLEIIMFQKVQGYLVTEGWHVQAAWQVRAISPATGGSNPFVSCCSPCLQWSLLRSLGIYRPLKCVSVQVLRSWTKQKVTYPIQIFNDSYSSYFA